MAADDDNLASEAPSPEQRAREAARRWRSREGKRKRSANKDAGAISDTTERLAKRLLRLRDMAAARALAEGSAPRRVQDFITRPPKVSEMTKALAERMIGETSDYLSIEFFERGLAAATCVGRILTDGGINGTGFLVAPDMVLTNHHVLWNASVAARSALELDYEDNDFGEAKRPQTFELEPAGFFIADKEHDFALVAVAAVSHGGRQLSEFGHLPLIADEGKIAVGESVNIVQHPRGRYKQIVIRNSQLVDLPEGTDGDIYFHYQADTEKGSSGSPVFSDQWEVVALHHAGVPRTDEKGRFLDADGKVLKEFDEERVAWVANEGIRTSRIVKAVSDAKLDVPAQHARRAGLLAKWLSEGKPGMTMPSLAAAESDVIRPIPSTLRPAPSPIDADRERAREIKGGPAILPAAGHALSLTIPLRIDVSFGEAAPALPATARAAASQADFQEAVRPDPSDPDYHRRPGYQPAFLGFPAPLPTLKDARHGPLATFGPDRATELTYYHFSVLMNARRRLAYVAAVNIDARAPFQHEREPGDRWFFDPRLPGAVQAGGEYYAANPLDRGHLVRRDDAAWGLTAEEAKLANDDTFHWTNCSPQHEIFNQSAKASQRGLQLWGNLENAVSALAQRNGDRLCVFNGPVFADDDRLYRQNFFVPRAFWKVIALSDASGNPRALAFRLSQAEQIRDLAAERFRPDELAAFEVFQLPVAQLESETGLDFGPLRGFDALAAAGGKESGAAEAIRPIRSEAEILL